MIQKLHISLIYSNLMASNIKLYNQTMCNLYAKYVKILEICKHFSGNLVNEKENVPRCGVVPKFSDHEVVALTFAAGRESIDSENWLIHSYDLSKASVHNINYLKDMKQGFCNIKIFGDKAYISEDIQLDLFEIAHIQLECPYSENQKNWKPTYIPYARARKRIETFFSQQTDQFLAIRNYAKETCGLFTRIIGKISALTVLQYVNYVKGKPLGRIKYALN